MEITVSGVPEYVNPNMNTKPESGEVVMYEHENVSEIVKNLGEDESSITNIRRLGKIILANHKPRFLLVTFNNPWVVRKKHSRTYRSTKHNETNKTDIFVTRSLSKQDQQKNRLSQQPMVIDPRRKL